MAGTIDVELGKITNTGPNFVHIYDTNGRDFYDITDTHRNERMKTYNAAGIDYNDNIIEIGNPIGVGTLEIGKQYKIETVGNTDFTLIGAGQNQQDTTFYATATSGTGSGTVVPVYPLKYHGPFDDYTRRRTQVRLLALDVEVKRDDTTISLSDTAGMFIPDREATKAGLNSYGVVIIGSEVIFYYNIDTVNDRILDCKRGQWGTSARDHSINQLETKVVHVLLDSSIDSTDLESNQDLFDIASANILDYGATEDPITDFPETPGIGWDSGSIVGPTYTERRYDFGNLN